MMEGSEGMEGTEGFMRSESLTTWYEDLMTDVLGTDEYESASGSLNILLESCNSW